MQLLRRLCPKGQSLFLDGKHKNRMISRVLSQEHTHCLQADKTEMTPKIGIKLFPTVLRII